MRTIVHRTKYTKNESERIRALDTDWKTDLSFPVRITVRLIRRVRIFVVGKILIQRWKPVTG